MTEKRRIALNVIATYGRSLFTLVCGLLTGRWVLVSLGQVDYGLLGLVGGLVAFVSFLNGLLSGAVSRFYAFYVGAAQNLGDAGIEECRKWFNTALLIHTAIPVLLIVIGYPIGIWAVKNYLTIPPDRVASCIWLWRFSCFSCFVGMANVPFGSMFIAKQEIAEMTLYNIGATAANVCFGYYMISHPGDWLVSYGAWAAFIAVFPQILICLRSISKYSECKFVFRYMFDWSRVKEIFVFASGRFVCGLSLLCCYKGSTIMVNRMLGPIRNAATAIGGTVAGQCSTLSGSFSGAFSPAITNAAGAGDFIKMRKYMFITCSVGVAALLLFALPILVEADYVIKLWLKNPPKWAAEICICIIIANIFEFVANGLVYGIFARGRIVKYQIVEALCWFSALPIGYALIRCHFDVIGYGIALIVVRILAVVVKVYYAKKECEISARNWILTVLAPSIIISILAYAAGECCAAVMKPSFVRLILSSLLVEAVFLPLAWYWLLPVEAKNMISSKVRGLSHIMMFVK